MIRKALIGLLIRLLGAEYKVDYRQIDRRATEEWAFSSFDDKGWRSYFAYEDIKMLKELGVPKPDYQYWMLIGRRMQLLYMFDEMRKAFENRKSASEKREAAKEDPAGATAS